MKLKNAIRKHKQDMQLVKDQVKLHTERLSLTLKPKYEKDMVCDAFPAFDPTIYDKWQLCTLSVKEYRRVDDLMESMCHQVDEQIEGDCCDEPDYDPDVDNTSEMEFEDIVISADPEWEGIWKSLTAEYMKPAYIITRLKWYWYRLACGSLITYKFSVTDKCILVKLKCIDC